MDEPVRRKKLGMKQIVVIFVLLGLLVAAAGYVSSTANFDPQQHALDVMADNRHRLETIPDTPAAPTRFVDVAQAAGLDYQWSLPGQSPRNIQQVMGNGCAFLDYDNDGNLDILLVGDRVALYRGDGHGHFSDVTRQMGLDKLHGHFAGCAVADYDNDGFDDIFLTGYHTAALLHDEHGTGFRDVTNASGIDTSSWSTSAAWGDILGNGRLDLYICNYCKFTGLDRQNCLDHGVLTTCSPNVYTRDHGRLYQNDGNGHFTDVTQQWVHDCAHGYTLGAAFADFDGSGRQSLFVSDDQVPSDLYQNVGAKFKEVGRPSGTDVNEDGKGYAGMGVDWGDYDNDGKFDLLVMDYWNEKKRMLHNEGGCLFTNQYDKLHCGVGGYPRVAFGVKWLDYDNDGWLDFVQCNGFTDDNIEQINSANAFREPTLLYHNDHGTSFDNVSRGLVGDAMRNIVGRGLAIGDYDNDGRVDVLVVDSDGKPLLLHNETPDAGHWLEINLVGTKSNRDGLGALITVHAGQLHQFRLCQTDGSYMSASDKRVHIGLGSATKADSISVRWPSGQVDTYNNVTVDQNLTLHEGNAAVVPATPVSHQLTTS